MTRVLIADDQALFREGLRKVLEANGFEVVGEAAASEEAVRLAAEHAPDVVLMDLRMPVLDGVGANRRIAQLPRAPRVVALTTFDDDASVFDALRAGALGYLLKDTQLVWLVEAVELAAHGRIQWSKCFPRCALEASMSVTEEKEFVLRFSLRAKFAEDEDSDDHERMPERVPKHNLDATDEVSRPRS